MQDKNIPDIFRFLISDMCAEYSDIAGTSDGFFMVNRSLAAILSAKGVLGLTDQCGERFACSKFYDDWFLYAVPFGGDHVYGLLKLREQEHDAEQGVPADGDTPGVTVSFISFNCESLLGCLADPTDENRTKLNAEINRVVAWRGQNHHEALKDYFADSRSQGAYLVAEAYVKTVASFAEDGRVGLPEHYREITLRSRRSVKSVRAASLRHFIEKLNRAAGRVVCDSENIYLEDPEAPDMYEASAILATHTGNTSVYSFGAEVEFHAKFLVPPAKLRIPLLGRSIYDSAIRADMTVGDAGLPGIAPFYRDRSKIVRRHRALHGASDLNFYTGF